MALPLIIYPMSPLSSFAGLLVPEFAEDMSAGRTERMNRVASKAINATLSYAMICAVFIYSFAEELGYMVYKSYDAGFYISTLAVVVPIMYLDHVTDSILKGIGEQVFSMWVNISDSLISIILVWLLIPRMGIMGYAIVIVIMEGFNFILSFLRLGKRIKITFAPVKSILIPLASAAISAFLSDVLFAFSGSTPTPLWLILKMIFSLAITIFFIALFNFISIINTKKVNA
ncbi:MAG: polysaccharide biosynthesis C-terminal domain-containing protein [Clostridia bacterium]|nr:polysaccharide biosynthesis C-terminal domain-containing protein [Clostridia bacterium]